MITDWRGGNQIRCARASVAARASMAIAANFSAASAGACDAGHLSDEGLLCRHVEQMDEVQADHDIEGRVGKRKRGGIAACEADPAASVA